MQHNRTPHGRPNNNSICLHEVYRSDHDSRLLSGERFAGRSRSTRCQKKSRSKFARRIAVVTFPWSPVPNVTAREPPEVLRIGVSTRVGHAFPWGVMTEGSHLIPGCRGNAPGIWSRCDVSLARTPGKPCAEPDHELSLPSCAGARGTRRAPVPARPRGSRGPAGINVRKRNVVRVSFIGAPYPMKHKFSKRDPAMHEAKEKHSAVLWHESMRRCRQP